MISLDPTPEDVPGFVLQAAQAALFGLTLSQGGLMNLLRRTQGCFRPGRDAAIAALRTGHLHAMAASCCRGSVGKDPPRLCVTGACRWMKARPSLPSHRPSVYPRNVTVSSGSRAIWVLASFTSSPSFTISRRIRVIASPALLGRQQITKLSAQLTM